MQAQVKKTKARFDKLKLDVMQKVDLLAASRCNMFSHVLANYQSSLLHFWEKTSRTMTAVAESFKGYQYYEFSIIKVSTVNRFLRNYESQKAESSYKHGQDGVYQNRGHGSITHGVMSLGMFSKKLKCILLDNFYVCGPTLMNFIPHLVSKVRKVYG